MSISVGFHIASLIGLALGLWYLARVRSRNAFLVKWASPRSGGVVVSKPFDAIKTFCQSYEIPYELPESRAQALVKVSYSNLCRVHFSSKIIGVHASGGEGGIVQFTLAHTSDTISEDQSKIESDFAKTFRALLVCSEVL
jgi:hypothetical protein